MADPYTVLRIDEIEPIWVAGVHWRPLRRTLGIDAFGINAYTASEAGEHVVEEHTEETLGHQEVYVVIAGRATFTLGEDELDAPQGTAVFVRDPTVRRSAVAVEAGTTVLAVGGVPGVHRPSAWEWFFEVEKFRASGDTASALELLADGREQFPENAGMLYATACWSAVAGDTEAAIDWLNAAIELEPRCSAWAANDADLDPIRGLPGSPLEPRDEDPAPGSP
jgi:hypothetical protein